MAKNSTRVALLAAAMILSLLLGGLHSACTIEKPTEVKILTSALPPTFKLSGTGTRPYFAVYGPYEANDKVDKSSPIWAITVEDSLAQKFISGLPEIIYGQIPPGFKQVVPKDAPPPNLEHGKYYSVHVHVLGAESGGTCFGIQKSRITNCP